MPQVPSNLYTGDAVVVNALPYAQIAQRHEAQRQAKQDALDKYYENMPQTINDKGVRDADVPTLNKMKDDMQRYWIQNRERIRKGNTPEAYNYGKILRDAQSVIQESKNRAATDVALSQMRKDPRFEHVFFDPSYIYRADLHNRPIGAEGSKAINMNELTLPPKPFSQADYMKGISGIKPSIKTVRVPIPGNKFQENEVTTPYLTDENLQDIYGYASSNLNNNYSFMKEIREKVPATPGLQSQIDEVFEKNYGRKPQNDYDRAAGYTLLGLSDQLKTVTKPVENRKAYADLAYGRQVAMANLRDNLEKGRMRYKQALGRKEEEEVLNKIIKDQYDNGSEVSQNIFKFDAPSEKGIKQIPVPVGLSKKYVKDAGLKTEKTPEFYMGKGGEVYIKYRDDAGNLDATQTIKMPVSMYKAELGGLLLGESNLPEEINDDLELDVPIAPRSAEQKPAKPSAAPKKSIKGF